MIFPVFAIAFIGYVVTWAGLFRLDDIGGLTRYVFNIALPIMLFDSMSKVSLPEIIRWSFMLAYYVPTVIVFIGGAWLGKKFFQYNRIEQGVYAMGCSYSNTVLIGLPVISTAWGDTALLPLMMIISVHSAILFSLTTAMAESGRSREGRQNGTTGMVATRTVTAMLKNPIFGGLIAGLIFNYLTVPVPAPVQTVLTWIRASALPAALFVTGASLRRFRVMGQAGPASTMLLIKLLVHPLLVWVAATVIFDLPPLWKGIAVITASLPTGINATVFAGKYNAAMAPVATTTLLSTAVAAITLSVLLVRLMPV